MRIFVPLIHVTARAAGDHDHVQAAPAYAGDGRVRGAA
ncbi:MAG: hypothetical protein JWQ95_795 [Sphaerisporangium sp.]|jgi:hypothetical protein|nr:hypothetical protein [Sphaerisporangium sp.]